MKKIKNGLELFNGKHNRFGGHWQKLSKLTGLDYLTIQIGWWNFSYDHEWYDGQHHWLTLKLIRICWGGKPFKDIKP
jgi:hypothetical protein